MLGIVRALKNSKSPKGDKYTEEEKEEISAFQELYTDNYFAKVSLLVSTSSISLSCNVCSDIYCQVNTPLSCSFLCPYDIVVAIQAEDEERGKIDAQVTQTLQETQSAVALIRQLQEDNTSLRSSLEHQSSVLRDLLGEAM